MPRLSSVRIGSPSARGRTAAVRRSSEIVTPMSGRCGPRRDTLSAGRSPTALLVPAGPRARPPSVVCPPRGPPTHGPPARDPRGGPAAGSPSRPPGAELPSWAVSVAPPPHASVPFHPLVADWFGRAFAEPTPAQAQGWPAIARGEHTLILAPTGSGKTLAAFLWGLNRLVEERLAGEAGTRLLYVSPLKALNYDVERNLRAP